MDADLTIRETRPIDRYPLDRDRLIEDISSAARGLVAAGIDEQMVYIVFGGLRFLITGEDGEQLLDVDIRRYTTHEGALAAMLFADLKSGWQGFPCDEDRKVAWKICDSIAAAFCRGLRGGR